MAFIPKPPPTSGFVTRISLSDRPNILANCAFCDQTPCPFTHRCNRPSSISAQQPRGSIELQITRLSEISKLTTWAALTFTASICTLSPKAHSKATLFGAASCKIGPPGCNARCTGRSSTSNSIISAATRACAYVSAKTMATGSPTKRTLSLASKNRSVFGAN